MKRIYRFFTLAAMVPVLTNCVDLDTEPLGSIVTSDQKEDVVEADPSKAKASVAAIFANFIAYTGTSSSDHDAIGYPGVMLALDHKGTDLVSPDVGYNWYRFSLNYNDVQSTSGATAFYWATMYNQIYTANAVTATIPEDTDDPTSQFYLAQALAVRAFDYFTLAQIYQHNYVGHEQELCVPIITEKNSASVGAEGCERATVEKTYGQILGDLNKAIELLEKSGVEREDKRYVSLDVAYGLRARIHLVMHKYAEAAEDAKTALDLTSSTPYTKAEVSGPTFIDIEDNSWMWGMLITDQDRVSTTGICNFPSHMGSLNYGYASSGAWKSCGKKFYALIPDTDVRKGWFLDATGISKNLTPAEQTYITGMKAPAFTQVKFGVKDGVLGTDKNDNDVPLMRVEEMYLIRAEALAMSGNPSEGKAILTDFVKTYRNGDYNLAASSPEDIQDAVWQQRRIEFWGEGMAYFDIMRLGKGVNRLGEGFPSTSVYNIEPGSDLLIYRIPYNEEQYNTLIVNNPAVAIPEPIKDEE